MCIRDSTNLVWSSASGFGSVGGIVSRYDMRTKVSASVEVWPQGTIGHSADEVKYRFVWTFPVHLSPHDHNRVYVGSQHVHATTDGGRSWSVISPDLSRNDRSRMVRSGGLTPDNIGVEYSGVVFAINESRLRRGAVSYTHLIAGVLVDRTDKLRLVRLAQVLLLVEALLLWWFTWRGSLGIPALIGLVLFGGLVVSLSLIHI